MTQKERTGLQPGDMRPFGFGPKSLRAGLDLTSALIAAVLVTGTVAMNMVIGPSNGASQAVVRLVPPIPLASVDPPWPALDHEPARPAESPLLAAAPGAEPSATRKAAQQTAAARAERTPSAASYIVVAGDTLDAIAKRFGLDRTKLLTLNGLAPNAVVVPGDVLQLGKAAPAQ
ncbi:LysM domain-containing protein [Arthrobacter sp. OAP107]|uniref:LysM peptidoglycan-binding domain-containing protein n=1 Tax=Arthrobacter sp. OAP107 TaxID=3156445 RepID=UPI003396E413